MTFLYHILGFGSRITFGFGHDFKPGAFGAFIIIPLVYLVYFPIYTSHRKPHYILRS